MQPLPLWTFVRSARFEDAPEVVLERKRPVQLTDTEALIRQGTGCFLKACAAPAVESPNGLDPDAYLEHWDTASWLMHRQIVENYEKHNRDYRRKMQTGFIASAAAF